MLHHNLLILLSLTDLGLAHDSKFVNVKRPRLVWLHSNQKILFQLVSKNTISSLSVGLSGFLNYKFFVPLPIELKRVDLLSRNRRLVHSNQNRKNLDPMLPVESGWRKQVEVPVCSFKQKLKLPRTLSTL